MKYHSFASNMAFLTLIIIFLSCLISSQTACSKEQRPISKSWFNEEINKKREILAAFWQKRIVAYNQKSVDDFKSTIIANHFPEDSLWKVKIENLFEDAIAKKINFDLFYNSLKDQPLLLVESMNNVEKLIPSDQFKEILPHINQENLDRLKQYMKDKQFSASITLGAENAKLITPNFPENLSHDAFAIHSVGKVFTGILVFIMMRENIISEDDLSKPVELDDTVIQQLPMTVREQLKNVTLYQLMTHKAGLGDYLGNYGSVISQGRAPVLKQPENFVPFIEDKIFPIGEFRYSNAGILLVGLAVKHAYEKKFHRSIDYDEILKKYIIDEVGMPSFTPWRPKNAKFNLNDPVAPYIVGSPAGGYWMTTNDLAKFGKWIYQKAHSDPTFMKLIEKYGQEFYHADNQSITHGGGISSSMAFFSVSLKTGAILAFASNQPPAEASDLKEMISRHIFSKKEKEDLNE